VAGARPQPLHPFLSDFYVKVCWRLRCRHDDTTVFRLPGYTREAERLHERGTCIKRILYAK